MILSSKNFQMCVTWKANAVKEKMETYMVHFLYIYIFDPLSVSYFIQNFGKNYARKLQQKHETHYSVCSNCNPNIIMRSFILQHMRLSQSDSWSFKVFWNMKHVDVGEQLLTFWWSLLPPSAWRHIPKHLKLQSLIFFTSVRLIKYVGTWTKDFLDTFY